MFRLESEGSREAGIATCVTGRNEGNEIRNRP